MTTLEKSLKSKLDATLGLYGKPMFPDGFDLAPLKKLAEEGEHGNPVDMAGGLDVLLDRVSTLQAQVAELEKEWRTVDGPGVDGVRVMLRELDPFDRFNRGDENRDAIASGYWSDAYGHYIWPFGCTDHPPTHWAPMPDRLTDKSKEVGA